MSVLTRLDATDRVRRLRASSSPFGSWLLGPEGQSLKRLRVRMQVLLTTIMVSTNLVAAAIAVLLSLFVLPRPQDDEQAGELAVVLVYAVAAPAYVLLAVAVGVVVGTRVGLRTLRWVTLGEEPTETDRRAALRLPWRLTMVQLGMWTGALVLFTLLALLVESGRALSIAITLTITAITSSAIAFLLAEFALRPVAAIALSDDRRREPRLFGVRRRQQVFWVLGTAMPTVGLMVEAVFVLTGEPIGKQKFAILTLVVGGVVLVFGGAVNALSARSVVAPITSVRRALRSVEDGDLDQRVPVFDGTELGQLQVGFNQMAAGLREREHLRDLFGRHVGQAVARAAAEGDVELGGETRQVTVLFVDLVASTDYANARAPGEVVEMLNSFFDVVVEEIDRRGGLVNKFMGDAVLAVFGAPTDLDDHAGKALAAARAMSRRLVDELPDVRAGVGIYSGESVAGNVGTRERFEYTVIGDAVNAAARLVELAKEVEPMLLTSWETVQAADPEEAAHWQQHDEVTLRGRSQATRLATCREP